MKRLDQKIANILRDPSGAKDFIIADAKGADMAFADHQQDELPVSGLLQNRSI